jgi:predicted exporter
VRAASERPRGAAWVLGLWLAVLLLAVLAIVRAPFVADMSAFLPAEPDARQRLLIEQLQSGSAARTLTIGIRGGADDAQRAAASKALAARLRSSGSFEQVHNGESAGFAEVGRYLFEQRYLLSPAVAPERFTPAGLQAAIGDTLALLGTPAGAAVKPVLERDPTGETATIAQALLPANAPRSAEGVWMAREGGPPRALLLATTRAEGQDLDGQAAALEALRSGFAALPEARGLTLEFSGAPKFAVESRARIETAAHRLGIAATVLVAALLWWVFRSPLALGVAMLPVATGVAVGIAAVGLGFGQIHGVTLGFGATLIGEAVDYAIYYLIQARPASAGEHREPGWRVWLRASWPTVRLGLFTSLAGFAALVVSGFPGLAQLGVFSCAGLVAAALTTRFVLPLLRPDGAALPAARQGPSPRQRLGRAAGRVLGAMPRARVPLAVLGAVAAVGVVVQHERLWRADLASLSPIGATDLALDAALRAELLPGEGGLIVVVTAADLEATLQRAEAATAALEARVDRGELAAVSSPIRWLPSQATQATRRAALPPAPALQAALVEATADGPLPAARLAPFVAEVQAARELPPITHARLRGTAVAPLLDAMLFERPAPGPGQASPGWAAVLPVERLAASGDTGSLAPALEQALAGVPGAVVLDIKPELDRLYAHYLGQAQQQTALGALAVLLLIGAFLRSPRRLLAVAHPLGLAVVFTLAGLAVAGVELGILHLVGLLLVVAVGSNYALFFDRLQHAPASGPAEDRNDTLASLALANGTTVLSFGLIALSGIPALASIGIVVAPGALLALLLAAAFARPGAAVPPPTGSPAAL